MIRTLKLMRNPLSIRFTIFIVLALYNLLKLDKNAPLTEGWWRVYSRWISQGLMPYRDFNLIVPPGMPYIDLFFSKVVGQSFYNLRFVGLVLMCLIALLMFEILRKLISQTYAVILSIIGTIILYSTEVVIWFDYNYFAIFFLILTVFLWQLSENYPISNKKSLLYSGLSGVTLGLSLTIKLNFGFFLGIFYLGIIIIQSIRYTGPSRKTIFLNFFSKFIGLLITISAVCLYFRSQNSLSAMFYSLFRESAGAKGSARAALFNWISYLLESYSYRKELSVVIFSIIIYFGLEKYLLPKYFDSSLERFSILKLHLSKKHLRTIYHIIAILSIVVSIISLLYLTSTGFENWWLVLLKQLAYIIIPHTFLIPVAFVFLMFFWSLKKVNEDWIPLLTLCLTLIWGAGTSGGLNWYATAIPLITIFAWVFRQTQYKEFLMAVTLLTSIAIATTTYASWIYSPYNWWGYRTPSVYLSNTKSDTALTKGLRMDPLTLRTLKSVEEKLKPVKDCKGGLMVFPHMPIFQLDLNSQPQRRDAIYWFDFVSQNNIKKAISEVERNPPAGFVIVNVPSFVWKGHSKAFNGGKVYAQKNLISSLLRESASGYSSWKYRLYNYTEDWSITVYTRDSCESKK